MKRRTPSFDEYINEAVEVEPEAIMEPKTKKLLKTFFEQNVTNIDKISFKRDGSIVAKHGYYYRGGFSPEKLAENLKKILETAGIIISIEEAYDDWKPWPKDSNFVIVFKIVSVK